jgi:hypothetical protein
MIECINIIEKTLTSLAIIVGGFWTYYKFIKGRLFKSRLELSIESKIIDDSHLLLNYELKNIGFSKVNLNKEASGIRIMKYYPIDDSMEIESSQWIHIGSFPIFEKHRWIESGETIKESNLLSLDDNNNPFYKSILIIICEAKSWEAVSITRNTNKQ